MRTLATLLLASCVAFGCATATENAAENDREAASDEDLVAKAAELRSYANAAAWTSSCTGPSITQADLGSMLGELPSRKLGRFEIAMRDVCSPWVNGASSCGPSGESREAASGQAAFAFGLDPSRVPGIGSWRFRTPLLVHDRGVVLARRVGARVVVQLVGDVSAVELGTQREVDGRVTGSERLRGRLLSSDLVRDDGAVRGVLRAAVGRDGVAIGARDVDAETLRWTSPPAPLADLALASRVYGRDRWSDSTMWSLQGTMTRSCLRLTDGMKTTSTVVTATFAGE